MAGFIAAILLMTAEAAAPAQSAGPDSAPSPPYFTDVTAQAGLAGLPGFRVTVCDINGDGYEDILLTRQNDAAKGDVYGKQMVLLNVPRGGASDPDGRVFTDFTAESNIPAHRSGANNGRAVEGMVGADVDNDGDNDLFLISYIHRTWDRDMGTNDLLINDGRGHFTPAANSPFHREPQWNTAAASFVDYDLDGNLDLLIANWYDANGKSQTARLYRGNGDGSFANVTAAAGIGKRKTVAYASAVSDWDNDGWPDLFVPNYGWTQPESVSLHFRNDRNGCFTPVQSETGYQSKAMRLNGIASFGSMFFDFDNDGDMDFIEVMTHGTGDGAGGVHTATAVNNGGVFEWEYGRVKGRGAEDPDLTHHGDHIVSYIDFDNDGLIDFLLTENGYGNNGLYLFKQGADHSFSPVTRASGLWPVNEAGLPSHNAAVFDYDHDGDADVLTGFADAATGIRLYRNDVGAKNHWIQIRLEGAGMPGKSNRNATGARIEVTAAGVTQTREVFTSNGHQGPQIPFTQYFGTAGAAVIDKIRIRWPNASHAVTELRDVPADRLLTVREPVP